MYAFSRLPYLPLSGTRDRRRTFSGKCTESNGNTADHRLRARCSSRKCSIVFSVVLSCGLCSSWSILPGGCLVRKRRFPRAGRMRPIRWAGKPVHKIRVNGSRAFKWEKAFRNTHVFALHSIVTS